MRLSVPLHFIACLVLALLGSPAIAATVYDPLVVGSAAELTPFDLTFQDPARDREVPVRIYLPAATTPAPMVIFSHGLGGSREGNPYLGRHWSKRGYAVVYLQHPGSDERVWKDAALGDRMQALRRAASGQNYLLRTRDIPFVLDQLTTANADPQHRLSGRLDLTRVGMSGHSFGAQTTQAVSGQSFGGERGQGLTDPRIKAALAMSPNAPERGDAATAFGSVKIPWLVMTGTKDRSFIGTATPETRLKVFPALPPGNKYQVILDGAEHSAFGDRQLPGDRAPRNPNHHRAILALSTAFWDAFLKDDANAKAWLNGDGPRRVLEAADLWETK